MATPHMPHLPGAAVMTDTLDFVKNLWGSMSVPGLTAPTLSVEELDKKINDLKAVETWLNLNMSMLRGSIQALEVQRGTIATLKSVGASLAAAVKQPPGSEGKSIFDANPYASAFFHHAREAGQQSAHTATKPTTNDAPAAPAPAPASPPPPEQQAKTPEPAATDSSAMTNPAIWWNMLQDQFKQAVSTAMASESLITSAAAHATDTAAKFAAASSATPAAKSDTKSAAKPAAKPAAKSSTASATNSATKSATNSATKPAAKPAARKAAPAKR